MKIEDLRENLLVHEQAGHTVERAASIVLSTMSK